MLLNADACVRCESMSSAWSQVEDKTVKGLLSLIEADRNGETVDKALLKHLVRMFISLGTYSGSFEAPFLETTTQYYSVEGQRRMQECDVPEYLLHCEVRFQRSLQHANVLKSVST